MVFLRFSGVHQCLDFNPFTSVVNSGDICEKKVLIFVESWLGEEEFREVRYFQFSSLLI